MLECSIPVEDAHVPFPAPPEVPLAPQAVLGRDREGRGHRCGAANEGTNQIKTNGERGAGSTLRARGCALGQD